MKFKDNSPIYLQICDLISRQILQEKWAENQRLPSVRELARTLEVNPNTVVRAYEWLQTRDIIFKKRGIGYSVSAGSIKKIIKQQRKEFIEYQLPQMFDTMELLGITMEELIGLQQKYLKN